MEEKDTSRINGNNLARFVTIDEGLKKSLPTGQVKEVISKTCVRLDDFSDDQIVAFVRRTARNYLNRKPRA